MFFCDYFNKDILTIKTADNLGTIKGVYINKSTKRPRGLMMIQKEKQYILPFTKIVGNNHKITVPTAKSLSPVDSTQNLYLLTPHTKAYTHKGKCLGNFVDLTIQGDKLIWFDKPYPSRYISAMKDNTLIINLQPKKTSSPPRKKAAPTIADKIKEDTPPAPKQQVSLDKPKELVTETPNTEKTVEDYTPSPYIAEEKTINDYSFLEGRIVIRDIVDVNYGLHIKKGTVINNTIIELARKSGKLVYLALSSLLE